MGTDRKEKIREMREICEVDKKRSKQPAMARLVYIELGFLFTRLLVKTKITPNQITWFWGWMLVVSSLLFLTGNLWLYILGAVGWMVFISMDYTDGHVARYKKMFSKRGMFFDTMCHRITWPLLFLCIGIGLYFETGEVLSLVFGAVAGMLMPLITYTPDVFDLINKSAAPLDGDNENVEGALFKNKSRFRLIRDINPLTFVNVYPIILLAVILDLALPELFPTVFPFEILWMSSFLSMLVFFYAVGFLLAFFVIVGMLYRRLD